jgi:hypothetical protein
MIREILQRRAARAGKSIEQLLVDDRTALRARTEVSMPEQRPLTWQKIINQETETCVWLAPDGSRHPGTEEENAEVRRELLNMRAHGESRNLQKSRERM